MLIYLTGIASFKKEMMFNEEFYSERHRALDTYSYCCHDINKLRHNTVKG